MSTVDWAVFDCDGTLADTLACFVDTFDEAAEHFGFARFKRERIQELKALDVGGMLAWHQAPLARLPEILAFARESMGRRVGSVALFPGIAAVLQELSQRGVQLGIISSNSLENVRAILGEQRARAFRYFACGVSLQDKAEQLRAMLRITGAAPDRVIYVGDEWRDLEAAQAAGVRFGAVKWGYQSWQNLPPRERTVMFEQVEELLVL